MKINLEGGAALLMFSSFWATTMGPMVFVWRWSAKSLHDLDAVRISIPSERSGCQVSASYISVAL